MPGEDYDLIFSNFVFHWLKNKELVFQKAQKMLKRGGLLAFCSPTEKDNLFPFGENIISEEFKENFLSNLFPIDIDCYGIKYGFETDYFCKDVAQFDMGEINGIIEFYMTHSLGKLCDVSHSNIEKMKEYFGDQCILSA